MILLGLSVLLVLAGGVAALALRHRQRNADAAFRILTGGGCALGIVPAARVLGGGTYPDVSISVTVPGGNWIFGIDPLTALFLIAIFTSGGASALYGISYLAERRERHRVGLAHLLTAVLLAALALVVSARAALPFLIAWEVMAVTAYALIVFEHERADARRAGLVYIVATHLGTLLLFALFAHWGSGAADLTFASLAERSASLAAGGAWVIALGLLGFGLKAGVVPLHFWLPEAHAAAPTHISALLSGVVIKMGIYGLMRVVLLLGQPPAWWGWLLLAMGAASGILGVVWALAQHDVKRLLAFHSVENIGIILLGLGAGVLGIAHGHPAIATLGFAGAALHTLNHALFKSLLFLGAGSVAHAAGTREIDRLGGVANRMPITATTFLIGSAAIVGLPPLNGFLSEWLVFRALFDAGAAGGATSVAILATVALGLIGALALACFAKVVGVLFLGKARHDAALDAHEGEGGLILPLLALATACIIIGLLPALVLPPLLRTGAFLAGVPPMTDPAAGSITTVTIVLGAGVPLVLLLFRILNRARTTERADTWSCGYPAATPRMQYTASSFAAPILHAFGPVANVHVTRSMADFSTHAVDPVMAGALGVWHGARAAAGRVRPIHRGRLALSLLWVVAALVVLLFYLLLAGHAA